jgi:hypothetical protein
VIVLGAVVVSVCQATPSLRALAPRRGVAWAGQIGVVAAIGLSAAFLVGDVVAVI